MNINTTKTWGKGWSSLRQGHTHVHASCKTCRRSRLAQKRCTMSRGVGIVHAHHKPLPSHLSLPACSTRRLSSLSSPSQQAGGMGRANNHGRYVLGTTVRKLEVYFDLTPKSHRAKRRKIHTHIRVHANVQQQTPLPLLRGPGVVVVEGIQVVVLVVPRERRVLHAKVQPGTPKKKTCIHPSVFGLDCIEWMRDCSSSASPASSVHDQSRRKRDKQPSPKTSAHFKPDQLSFRLQPCLVPKSQNGTHTNKEA